MPGFILTNAKDNCILNEINKITMVNRIMELNEYKVYQNTLNQFINDKIFEEDDEIAIILEGVIYNSIQIKNKYHESSFFGAVKKMAYNEGEVFFKEFRGSFSGIIYYKIEKRIVIFTNHIGDEPVFYYKNGDKIIIASEIMYILDNLKSGQDYLTLNEEAVMNMLTFGFMESEVTYANEIKRLLPGHYIVISDGRLAIKKYYRLSRQKNISGRGMDELIEKVDASFRNAIKLEFDKDKEYGYSHLTDLSGGLDSRMTMWVASEMGYSPMVHLTFCQSGYLDEKIATQISAYWKHNLIFEPMDDYGFMYDIEQIVRMNGGLGIYSATTGGKRMISHLNTSMFGLEHTGQVGDAVLGASLANGETGMYSEKLSNKITDTVVKQYAGDNELYLMNIRGFLGALATHLIRRNYIKLSSPFLDVDFLELCYSIPASVRAGHKLYKAWIKKKYPEAAMFVWETTGQRIDVSDIQVLWHKLIHKGPLKLKKLLHIQVKESSYGMNPVQYWYNNDKNLQNYFDAFFSNNISNKIIPDSLKETIIKFYNDGTAMEKTQVLTLLCAINMYFPVRI